MSTITKWRHACWSDERNVSNTFHGIQLKPSLDSFKNILEMISPKSLSLSPFQTKQFHCCKEHGKVRKQSSWLGRHLLWKDLSCPSVCSITHHNACHPANKQILLQLNSLWTTLWVTNLESSQRNCFYFFSQSLLNRRPSYHQRQRKQFNQEQSCSN